MLKEVWGVEGCCGLGDPSLNGGEAEFSSCDCDVSTTTHLHTYLPTGLPADLHTLHLLAKPCVYVLPGHFLELGFGALRMLVVPLMPEVLVKWRQPKPASIH